MTDKFFFEAFLSIIRVIKHFKKVKAWFYLYRNARLHTYYVSVWKTADGARNFLRHRSL